MDFWKTYTEKKGAKSFGSSQLWLKTGERWNTSILRYKEFSDELQEESSIIAEWNLDRSHIIAKNIISDIFLSFYDVNTRTVLAIRTSSQPEKYLESVYKMRKKIKNPNIEIRAIGLQNSQTGSLTVLETLAKAMHPGKLAETDLFGNQKRHIIMDLYTGRVYNLLLENRIYRPGELIATQAPPGSPLQSGSPIQKPQVPITPNNS